MSRIIARPKTKTQSPKIDLRTVRYAHGITRKAFLAGVEWMLEALKDCHAFAGDFNVDEEQFREEIHQQAERVIKAYQETVEENLGLRTKDETELPKKLA